ncbi:hypothetical protein Tco_0982259 [Tanacetum coccineum]
MVGGTYAILYESKLSDNGRNDGAILQNRRDLPRDNPLVSIEVLRYDIKRSKSENKGIVPTEMELVLEQTQQGTSHEVLVNPYRFEDSHKDGDGDQERYEHVGPKVTSTQDGERPQDDDKRLHLADDLKKLKITYKDKLKRTSSSHMTTSIHKIKDKESRLRARLKTFIEC